MPTDKAVDNRQQGVTAVRSRLFSVSRQWGKSLLARIPLRRHHQVLLLLLLSALLWCLETSLVESRFALMRAADWQGRAQSHPLDSWLEKIVYIGLSFSIMLLLTGLLYYLWLALWRRKPVASVLLSYHFVMLWGSLYVFCVVAKFKVLTYFSDTISFSLVTNLSGGHLFAALRYVLSEATTVIAYLALFLTLYALGHVAVKRLVVSPIADRQVSLAISGLRHKTVAIAALILLALIGMNQHDNDLRYALRQHLSFYWLSQAIRVVTDVDGDGYSAFIFPTDSAPFDASINPMAVDIPNNGIDEDQLGGDFQLNTAPKMPSDSGVRPAWADNPGLKHIVIIVLESTRADVIGKWVNGQVVAPNINQVAENGSVIRPVYSHSGYTATSLKALFNQSLVLSDRNAHASLADFKRQGYSISVFSAQAEDFGDIARDTGMRKYSDYYFDAKHAAAEKVYGVAAANSIRLDAQRVFSEFKQRLPHIDWQQPQLVYINLQSAHFPYSHAKMPHRLQTDPIPRHKIKRNRQVWLRKTYWNAVNYADQVIGEVIAELDRLGVKQQTLLMITADHGESLYDGGGIGHGHAINDVQTAIPLVLSQPGINWPTPLGQIEILNIARLWAGLDPIREPLLPGTTSVFQYIGDIAEPAQIANLDSQGRRTLFDVDQRRFYFEDLNRWLSVEAALQDSLLAPRCSQLLQSWEVLKWNLKLASPS